MTDEPMRPYEAVLYKRLVDANPVLAGMSVEFMRELVDATRRSLDDGKPLVDWRLICQQVIKHVESYAGTHFLPYPPYRHDYWYNPDMPDGLTHGEAEALFELVKEINEWNGR